MNTEKFIVWKADPKPEDTEEIYFNHLHNFIGPAKEAKKYAIAHNFQGGVETCVGRGKYRKFVKL